AKSQSDEYRTILLVLGSFVLLPYAFTYDMGALFFYAALLLVTKNAVDLSGSGIFSKGTYLKYGIAALLFALPLWTPIQFIQADLVFLQTIYLLPPIFLSFLLLFGLRSSTYRWFEKI
ncbi:MAG: hypothetical protein WBC71_06845, partial [Salaquimonas sp.]